jgi:hypothetical protein
MKMDYKELIPKPILFNCWKHHLGFIKKELNTIKVKDEKDIKDFVKRINIMGNSLTDLYIGLISAGEITNYILKEIDNLNLIEESSYKNWLHNENRDYKIIKLPDDSTWTLRYGNEKERYIHIHPARYSVYSVRVKSISLKTASLLFLMIKQFGGSTEDINIINKLRVKYLKASPLKTISSGSGLGKVIELFVES